MAVVILVALALVFVPSQALTVTGTGALVAFLVLARGQFRVGTWVPLILSLAVLALALGRDVPAAIYWQAMDRMLFLAALIAILGTLRSAAAIAPEVARAGVYVTSQPASRRYLAMTFGGHLFGVLINFGGLALLLDLTRRAMADPSVARLPPPAREARLKRMTVAVIRGFSLISLWSPFGFATNVILIALPGVTFMEFGPLGFAMSFVFIAIGWTLDRIEGRRFRQLGLPRPSPPPGSWRGAAVLVGHVLALGGIVGLLHEITPLSFQQALILSVPVYAMLWAASAGRRGGAGEQGGLSGPGAGIAHAARSSWTRLADLGAEVGVFASAGFLPVVLLALIPAATLQEAIAALGLGPVALALGLCLSVVAVAMLGVNPIVTASVLGAIAAQLGVPGLSDAAIALAITGGWTSVIGLSPFMTTVVIGTTILGRGTAEIGLRWNGPYCLATLTVWMLMLSALMLSGLV